MNSNKLLKGIWPANRTTTTSVVSNSCDKVVDALFLSHKCFPLVSFFQKWKSRISRNCALRYAIIEAPITRHEFEKTWLYTSSDMGDSVIAGKLLARSSIPSTIILAKNPMATTKLVFLRPYSSLNKSVIKNVMG